MPCKCKDFVNRLASRRLATHDVRMAVSEPRFGAARAVDELYRAHAAEVYRYAYAVLGNRADAEDVTQTTFVNALRALERGERPRTPTNWLITIAHNVVRQRFRQQQARPAEVELDPNVAAAQRSDDDGTSIQDLVRALQRIPPSQREALVMRELEGRSYKEISGILGLSNSALETLLFRARRSLAEELDNLVSCERAERSLSRQLDGRLSRKERRRLDAHMRECASCAGLQASRSRSHRAFKGLALLPLPLPLTLFKAPSASAAAGLSTIGTGAAGVAGGVSLGTAGGTAGGLAAGGVVAKVAAIVAVAAVAGGTGYEGVKQVQQHSSPKRPAKAAKFVKAHSHGGPAAKAAARHGAPHGKGRAATHGKAHSRPAPGRAHAVGKARHVLVRVSMRARSRGKHLARATRARPSVRKPVKSPRAKTSHGRNEPGAKARGRGARSR